jgi:glycosyltransferase involved in cell wall biosynthesis
MGSIPSEPDSVPKQTPLISIITVVYNSRQFLESTIQSIATQESTNFEYIIIDGGSTDGTLDIIKRHSDVVDHWISEPDKGLYDAMNKGLKAAKGEYVWFINSGDKIYEDNTISLIESMVNQHVKPDVIYGETLIIDTEGREIGMRRLSTPETLTWEKLIDGLVVCHQSIIIKRSIAPFYNLKFKISADYDWVLTSLRKAKVIENSRLILSRYLDNGMSKNNIPRALKERFQVMRKNFGFGKTIGNHILIGFRFVNYVIKNRRF